MDAAAGGVARRYHEATKHSFDSVRSKRHPPDPARAPQPFKRYRGGRATPLPRELSRHDVPALDALIGRGAERRTPLELAELARLLRFGAGVVRTRRLPSGETFHFRTYSSAGALYPLELYVGSAELPGLPAALYHFDPLRLELRRLRAADARGALASLCDRPSLREAGAALVVSGIIHRTAWKYGERGLRHLFWDAGTMAANLLALAASAGLDAELVTGFVDERLSELLGVDGDAEAPLFVVGIGRARRAEPPRTLAALEAEPEPSPSDEPPFPLALELQAASRLADVEELRAWRRRAAARPAGGSHGTGDAGPTASDAGPLAGDAGRLAGEAGRLSRDTVEDVILRRGSARAFARRGVPAEELAAILGRAMRRIPVDVPAPSELRLIANRLDGLDPGAYRFADGRFDLLGAGSLREAAGYLCLEQALGAQAAATHFLLADLDAVLGELGERGYRAAQLDAGVRIGRVYLGAYAQCLGASGLTFYDDDVTTFLAPGLSPMTCVVVGVDGRREALLRRRARMLGHASR
ncbi:MAG: SagB family peptide dehydrogenase [Nocardioidaceae bacterium]